MDFVLRKSIASFVFLLFVSLSVCEGFSQEEKILRFDSHIVVHSDSSMTVTETIEVFSRQENIKRGIYREFPTDYRTPSGNKITVRFDVISVLRDGRPEPYHIQRASNGKRVYIGDKNRFLPAGNYTYTIEYKTDRQIGYFDGYDELYWNVTGNGWMFAIEKARAVIQLPPEASVLQQDAYTGPQGAKGKDFQTRVIGQNEIEFTTTRRLNASEGLTVAVAWPKGIVQQPTTQDRIGFLIQDNSANAVAGILFAVLLVYYTIVWFWVGKDIPKGIIKPAAEAPDGLSPAACHYVSNMGFALKGINTVFAASIVSLAVKGLLKIQKENGSFTLLKQDGDASSLPPEEKALHKALFKNSPLLVLKRFSHKVLRDARYSLKQTLKEKYQKGNFISNTFFSVVGVAITFCIFLGIFLTADEKPIVAFLSVWLSVWTLGCTSLVLLAFNRWSEVKNKGSSQLPGAFGITLGSLPFLFFEGLGFWLFSKASSPVAVVFFMSAVAVDLIFFRLMKAPTEMGRRLMDRIEGFQSFLQKPLGNNRRLIQKEYDAELFERYLPYAIALGIEREWSVSFERVLDDAAQKPYQPSWYAYPHLHHAPYTGLANDLSFSLTSAISSSSSSPGSLSGSGGGGCSGGGGGGGGGGGW